MKSQPIKILLFSLVSLYAFQSRASESQYWTSMQVTAPLKNEFSLYGELVNRYSDDKDEFVTRSNRLGIGYKISPELSYTFIIENRDTNSDANDEIRFINQLQHNSKFEIMNLTTRLRIENIEFANTPVYALRLRLFLRGDFEKFQYGVLTPFASVEQYYIVNDTKGRPEGSTERRNQIGFSFPIDAIDAKADLSYLDRIVERAEGLGLQKSTSTYSIVNFALKWNY